MHIFLHLLYTTFSLIEVCYGSLISAKIFKDNWKKGENGQKTFFLYIHKSA
jgi:hypothetical protein